MNSEMPPPQRIRRALRPLVNQRGVTLMVVLVMVVIVGLGAGMAGSTWKTVMQREREEELLFRGDQIRKAIESYASHRAGNQPSSSPQNAGSTPGRIGAAPGGASYPNTLDDLLRDPRSPSAVRHLRKLFKDPFTGEDWVLIKDPAGRVKGVKSASTLEPFKQDGFPPEYASFKGAAAYADWQFVYEQGQRQSTNTTGGSKIRGLPGVQQLP